MATPDRPKLLTLQSQELALVGPRDFIAAYPSAPDIDGLRAEISRIGGKPLIRAHGYGSAFSSDARKGSRMDILLVVDNQYAAYYHLAKLPEVRLGSTRDPGFQSELNYLKGNFYLTRLNLNGKKREAKVWVISLDEFAKHARGGRPGVPDSKGGVYLSGRMHKAMFPIIVDNATPEQRDIFDTSFNQARLDGIWLTLGLSDQYVTYRELAEKYVNLSYAADRRVEKAGKSQSLLKKNDEFYEQMLRPIINCFVEKGILEPVEGKTDVYEKRMSLAKEDVEKWLKRGKNIALFKNIFLNYLTMGPWNSLGYELSKVIGTGFFQRNIRKLLHLG